MGCKILGICIILVIFVVISVVESQTWRGNLETYKVWEGRTCSRCICRYARYCGWWRFFTCNVLVDRIRCLRGWRHNGDYNCVIPICPIGCGSVGVCTAPNTCDCRNMATGKYCQTLICSYATPCYPGECYDNNKCNCTLGYTKAPAQDYGCLKMDNNNKPYIGRSTTIIEHIRRTDNSERFLFNFFLDGTDESPDKLTVWSNQRVFNVMHFYFEVTFEPPESLGERPLYVHNTKVGITEGKVLLRVLNFRNEVHEKQQYDISCPSSNPNNPQQLFNCTKNNEEFKTLIEHADTLRVTFEATNGGYREMTNNGALLDRERFQGQTSRKNVYFKFDFQAPKHCTENATDGYTLTDCSNSTKLEAASEFTKEPIKVHWKGWTDDRYGSQMWMYYLELHKLVVEDATLKLTERDPIGPMATNQTTHMGQGTHYQTFTPKEPGMYSVLLEVRDIANNSRIARRFVLFDNVSDVEVNQESQNGLHVSSARNHTGYKWQSTGTEGGDTNIVVDWTGYFMNKAHEEGHYNNEIKTFKPQFEDLEDDGVLFTRKFVDPALDDNEGRRTLDPIPNIHGIVKFEYQLTEDVNAQLPGPNWNEVLPLSESTIITRKMNTGSQLKIWVRAHDVLGNSKKAFTTVTTDFTGPIISDNDDNTTTYMVSNSHKGPYNYSSSLFLEASDSESGVRELGVNITIKMPGVPDINVMKVVKAHTDDTRHPDRDKTCVPSKDKSTCFLKDQTVYIDNCWLTVPNQLLLPSASATVEVIAYNQAMLSRSVSYEIPAITDLDGLVSYNGPESARVEKVKSGSFRITWDFPTKMSCYAFQTSIILVIFKHTSDGNVVEIVTHTVSGSATYFDVANLDADTEYSIDFTSKIGNKENTPLQLSAKTAKNPPNSGGVSVGPEVSIAEDCDFKQTIIAKAGDTATFSVDFPRDIYVFYMEKTSGAASELIFRTVIFDDDDERTDFYGDTFEGRIRISSQSQLNSTTVKMDLSNVSMNDNGTYSYYLQDLKDRKNACFVLFILDGPTQPFSLFPEKRHHYLVSGDILSNIRCTSECNPPCNITWGNYSAGNTLRLGTVTTEDTGEYTCTATRADGQAAEETISIYVASRPNHHLELVPEQLHYYLVTGNSMPDIVCTSDCYPSCNVSWGKHSNDNTLSLGIVDTRSTGEYTCTATRSDGQSVKKTVSVFIVDDSYFMTAIVCLATFQVLTIIVLALMVTFLCRRRVFSCCNRRNDSKKNKQAVATFSTSAIQGSENMNYEDLEDESMDKRNTYSEVNLAITDDEAMQTSVSTY